MKTKERSFLTAQDIRRQVEQDPGVQTAERRLDAARARVAELEAQASELFAKLLDLQHGGESLPGELLRLAEQGADTMATDLVADVSEQHNAARRQLLAWERAVRLAENELAAAKRTVIEGIYRSEKGEHKEILRRQLAKAAELAIELKAEEDFCQKYAENSFPLGRESFNGVSALQSAFSPLGSLRSYVDIMVDRGLLTPGDIPTALTEAWKKGGE